MPFNMVINMEYISIDEQIED